MRPNTYRFSGRRHRARDQLRGPMIRYGLAGPGKPETDFLCGLNQLWQLARRARVAVSHELHSHRAIDCLTSDEARDRYRRV